MSPFRKLSRSSSLDALPRRSEPRSVDGRRDIRFCNCPLRVDIALDSPTSGRKPFILEMRGKLAERAGEGAGSVMVFGRLGRRPVRETREY